MSRILNLDVKSIRDLEVPKIIIETENCDVINQGAGKKKSGLYMKIKHLKIVCRLIDAESEKDEELTRKNY